VSQLTADASQHASDAFYQQVVQFYARQMRLLDAGRVREWADTFTEDGTFEDAGRPGVIAGRAAISESARAHVERAGAVQRRHWLGMVEVTPAADGTLAAHCYALVIATARGERPQIHSSVECRDTLVPGGSTILVRHRHVSSDGA
jgi:hypothetical protein